MGQIQNRSDLTGRCPDVSPCCPRCSTIVLFSPCRPAFGAGFEASGEKGPREKECQSHSDQCETILPGRRRARGVGWHLLGVSHDVTFSSGRVRIAGRIDYTILSPPDWRPRRRINRVERESDAGYSTARTTDRAGHEALLSRDFRPYRHLSRPTDGEQSGDVSRSRLTLAAEESALECAEKLPIWDRHRCPQPRCREYMLTAPRNLTVASQTHC